MPRLISVDLGSHQVKISTWRQSGRGPLELEERHALAVPQAGEVPDLEARLAVLDAMLEDHPTLAAGPSDRCVLVLPGELATYHRLVLPFSDRAQIESTMEFALEAEVPFDLDDMVVGWRVIDVTEKSEVLAVVARHAQLAEWIAGLAARGLDPERVYVDAELLGAVVGGPSPGGGALAVVDVGHSHTAVAVFVDGKVRFCRTISVAGHAFTKAIQVAQACSWADAEARKHGTLAEETSGDDAIAEHGSRSAYASLPEGARRGVDGAIGLLLAELRSSLLRAEDDLGVEIDEVRLTGGGGGIRELWNYIAADLGVPVRAAESSDGVVVPSGRLLERAALTSLGGDHEAVDLRIGDLAFRGGTDLLRAVVTYGAAGAGFFALAAIVLFGVHYRSLSVEQAAAEEAIALIAAADFPEIPSGMSRGTSAVSTMVTLTEDAQQRALLLGSGGNTTPPTIDLIARLTDAFPPHPTVTVEVRNLSITPESIRFEAETDGYASSAKVEESLQASPDFKTAIKGDETRLSSGRVRFPISIPLDSDGQPTDAVGEEG
jgi:Tfp pilus assembly PilM family ATPase